MLEDERDKGMGWKKVWESVGNCKAYRGRWVALWGRGNITVKPPNQRPFFNGFFYFMSFRTDGIISHIINI